MLIIKMAFNKMSSNAQRKTKHENTNYRYGCSIKASLAKYLLLNYILILIPLFLSLSIAINISTYKSRHGLSCCYYCVTSSNYCYVNQLKTQLASPENRGTKNKWKLESFNLKLKTIAIKLFQIKDYIYYDSSNI